MEKIAFCDEINGGSASAFVAKVNGLKSRSAASVYISTPGGDIFAGGDMVNAVEHAIERGCKLSFEMGACVASMGASLIAAAKARGCKVVARENTQMMFHGCYVALIGGADELGDAAKCLSDFNSVVIGNLEKLGIGDARDWFAADREKWLNAKEAVALGIADEIVGIDESAAGDFVTVANRFAAKWNGGHMADEIKPEEAKPEEVAAPIEAVDEQKPAEDVKEETPAPVDMVPRAEADARVSGMQSAMQRQINDLKIQLDAKDKELAEAKAETTRLSDALKAESEKVNGLVEQTSSLTVELQAKTEALATLNGRVNKINNIPTREEALAAAKSAEERMAIREKYARK